MGKKAKAAPAKAVDSFTEVWGGPEEWVMRPCAACGFKTATAIEDKAEGLGKYYCARCWAYGPPDVPQPDRQA